MIHMYMYIYICMYDIRHDTFFVIHTMLLALYTRYVKSIRASRPSFPDASGTRGQQSHGTTRPCLLCPKPLNP